MVHAHVFEHVSVRDPPQAPQPTVRVAPGLHTP
jgi:hypothetical protein